VFGTIAAESQRLINETYTAFIQSFMPITVPDFTVDTWTSRPTPSPGSSIPTSKLKDYTPTQWDDLLYKPLSRSSWAPPTSPTRSS
jgi:hypothetical protein